MRLVIEVAGIEEFNQRLECHEAYKRDAKYSSERWGEAREACVGLLSKFGTYDEFGGIVEQEADFWILSDWFEQGILPVVLFSYRLLKRRVFLTMNDFLASRYSDFAITVVKADPQLPEDTFDFAITSSGIWASFRECDIDRDKAFRRFRTSNHFRDLRRSFA